MKKSGCPYRGECTNPSMPGNAMIYPYTWTRSPTEAKDPVRDKKNITLNNKEIVSLNMRDTNNNHYCGGPLK